MDPRMLAACLFAVDSVGTGGAVVRAPSGPVRESWLAGLQQMLADGLPFRRVPPGVSESRLLGGLDVAATLAAGRLESEQGILAEAEAGVILLPMSERCGSRMIGHLAQALDRNRLAIVALDESEPDERGVDEGLADRLAFLVDLRACRPTGMSFEWPDRRHIARARDRLAGITAHPQGPEICAEAAQSLGIGSLRRMVLCLHAATAHAALAGNRCVVEDDLVQAAVVVFAPYAELIATPVEVQEPPSHSAESPGDAQEPRDGHDASLRAGQIADRLVSASRAALPPNVLVQSTADRRGGHDGRAGAEQASHAHGRPVGSRAGEVRDGARIHLLDTLRAALPWQRLRGRGAGPSTRVSFRPSDLRIQRLQRRVGETVILVVDASGSTALHRLGEAKGAAELLLARSYVRRDQVALVVFRGSAAVLALPPTRSVARARRALSALPGGGGTPLALAIDAARDLADRVRREGGRPHLVFLTDGQANVARDGTGGRARARGDALDSAAALARSGIPSVLIDTSRRPNPFAAECAARMRGQLLPLPSARADALHAAIQGVLGAGRSS